jgi:hypothetical protein
MNYILLIKQLWRIQESENLSIPEIALYFYLLEISNKLKWRNPFKRNNAKIQADLGIKSFDKLSDIRKRLRDVGLIDFETQNGDANVVYRLIDLSILSKGKEGGSPEVRRKVLPEVHGEVLPELSKVKTKNLNLNINQEKVSHSTDSQALYQELQNFFDAHPNELTDMLKPTQIKTVSRGEIDAVILKFCEWYEKEGRISPDFEKNKIALAKWFCKEKRNQYQNKPSASTPKKSKEDEWRDKGLYD